jgi:hypothetical protein
VTRLTGGGGVGPVGRRASPRSDGDLRPVHERENMVRHAGTGERLWMKQRSDGRLLPG